MTKIYVISRTGNVVDTIKRVARELVRHKGFQCVLYKGKKYVVKDMRHTNINGFCIYPWGVKRRRVKGVKENAKERNVEK